MKKRIALLTVLTMVITTVLAFGGYQAKAAPQLTFQRVNFVTAQANTDVNVREAANSASKIVCVLKKGQQVKVFGKLGDWYAVYEPNAACVGVAYAKYLTPVGSTSAPAPAATTAPKPAATTNPNMAAPGALKPDGVSTEEQQLLDLVNKARRDAGLHTLVFDMEVMKVARLKAKDMVDKNYFSHQSPTYGSPFDMLRKFNVSFKSAGENIAGNQTVDAAFKAWMNSPGHKANILSGNYNYCGFGIAPGSSYGKIFVQMFISK